MPRIAKWIMLKEWLTFEDVVKVRNSAPSELENVFSKDESEELKQKYKFVCTFCPRQCQTVFREYRFEETARQGMRAHLKDHVKALKRMSSDEQAEFLTRNQLYQPGKGHKHKTAAPETEVPAKRARASVSTKAAPKNEQVKKKQFTQLKRKKRTRSKGSTDIDSPPSTSDAENNDTALLPLLSTHEKTSYSTPIDNIKLEDEELVEVKDETLSEDEEDDQDDDNEEDTDNKEAGCQTQTDADGRGVETLQYKMSTKLFAMDRSQWGNIEQVLDDLLSKEEEELSEETKRRVILSMEMWMESSQIFDHLVKLKLQDPLSPQEQETLNSMTPEDWQRLDMAKDDESKLRLMAYARLLLRDYEWYPRKLKPKKCRHCQKEYTASTSLNSHLMSLSGIRFWVCGRCKRSDKDDATFTRKHSLQYHILKEAGIPRYRCSEPGCSKTHNHTHHQRSHARQHTGEKHYICKYDGCKGQFSNRNTYSRHLLQHHNAELTKANAVHEIDEKEAQLRVFAARLKARERSKVSDSTCKRHTGVEGQTQSVEQRALTHLMQNQSSSNTPEIEDLLKPSASQALYRVARDIRKERADTGSLGGLNLLATVSNYMNVEECKSDSEKEQNDAASKSPSYTKLIEALDIDQSPRKVCSDSRSAPSIDSKTKNSASNSRVHGSVISSPGMSVPDSLATPSTSKQSTTRRKESATVIPKPATVLLPLPSGGTHMPKQTAPSQTQRLPNTIQNLKARLIADNVIPNQTVPQVIQSPTMQMTRPASVQLQPSAVQVIRPTGQPSTMQVVRPITNNSQLGTSKIIINLAQQIPVVSTPNPVLVMDRSQSTMSSILSQHNASAAAVNTTNVAPQSVTVLNKQTGVTPLANSLFNTNYFVVATPTKSQSHPVSLNTTMVECKTVPFSQL